MDGIDDMAVLLKGGSGSGHHGHAGRAGQRGGSSRGGERFGLEADAEMIGKKLGIPPEVASKLLKMGMIGVSLPRIPEVKPTESEAIGTYAGKKFPGQCYDMAARYTTDQIFAGNNGVRLVHGTISDNTFTIGHAWAEVNNKVFDGSQQAFYDKAEYYASHRAVAERTYDQATMYKNMVKYRHYGPWHTGAGIVAGKKGKKEE